MKTLILLLVMTALLVPISCEASADPVLDHEIQLVQSQIQHYENMAYVLMGLTAAVFVIGLIVGLTQPFDFRYKKVVITVLGFISAAIVGLNHLFFPAEYRAYEKLADQTRIKVNAFSRQLAVYPTLDDATKTDLRKQFGALQNEIDQMEYTQIDNATLQGATTASAHGLSLLPEAWAQEPGATTAAAVPVPDWAKAVPVDGNLYYLGTADGRTFEEAHDKAIANARTGATSAWVQTAGGSQLAGKTELVGLLAKALGSAAELAQSFVAPAPGGGFRGYVLLRLSRSAAGFTAQSIFSEAGAPPDEKLLSTIKREAK